MGLVMASKNLKAIVVRGTRKMQLADQKSLTALNRTGPKLIPENGDMDGLAKFGTAVVVLFNNTIGTLPTRNYNEGQFEGCEPISGEKMAETILKERDTCHACVVKCKRVVEINDGAYKVDPKYGGAGMDTISYVLAMEEISKWDASTSVVMSVNNSLVCYGIQEFGTEEQKQKYLPDIATGKKLAAFGLTEANAGSDAGGLLRGVCGARGGSRGRAGRA